MTRVTRAHKDAVREQISNVVDSKYAPSSAEKCTQRKELLRISDQVSLLTKAVSQLLVDFKSYKSHDKMNNSRNNADPSSVPKNTPRPRGRSWGAKVETCRGLHHRSIRQPPPNAGPAPQRGLPHPLSTASQASIPPLPPVPHADGTSSGTHSAGKQRHASSLPRFQKATPPMHPSDTALRTHRPQTRTRPPGDGPSPTTNPTTGPE